MNSGSFGYCTIKLANDLKFLTKTFTEQTDLKQKTIPPIYFDRPNTFFWFDGTNYLPFQFKLGKEWFKQKNRDAMTDSQFNEFIFGHFLERRLLNISTPNFLFGLVDSPRVFIIA